MNTKRVVITGVGPVSAIGIGREAFFDGIRTVRSGIQPITRFKAERSRCKHAAEIASFDVKEYLETEKNYLDRGSELAFAALSLALEDADLDARKLSPADTGLILGSAFGSLGTMALYWDDFVRKGPRFVKPILFPHTYANTAIGLLSIEYGLSGHHTHHASGCISSSAAIVEGFDLIRRGKAKVVFTGGFDALNETLLTGYDGMGLLSPSSSCAPFDRARNGFLLGEGAAILVLEDLDSAEARGATIYAEILGAGMVSDSTVATPDGGNWIVEAMQRALKGQPFSSSDLDWICANANGSPHLDLNEAIAIAALPGAAKVPVSSIKSMLGETLGASGALQLSAALAAMNNRAIPPTLNLNHPPATPDLNWILNAPAAHRVSRVLATTVDPGGSIVSILIGGHAG